MASTTRGGQGVAGPGRVGDLVAVIAWLALLNIGVSQLLEGWAASLVQVVAAALAVAAARFRGYGRAELGLEASDVPAGVRLGGLVSATVAVAIAMAAAVPFTSQGFEDERFADLSAAEAVVELGLRIPLVTALSEELLFRSVLLAVLLGITSTRRAVVVSSLLFGLWHVLTTLGDLDGNEVTDGFGIWEAAGAVLVVVGVTAVGGAVFCWLRLRSGSVVAPWLVHSVLNASTFAAGLILAE